MDRDNNWDRIQKAYDSLVSGTGVQATDAVKAMETSYADGVTDEFVLPTVITDEAGKPVSVVKENDSVIFFNFRPVVPVRSPEHSVTMHLPDLNVRLFR